MKFKNIVQKLKIWDGTDELSIIGDGDSLTGIKGLLVFGEDISGNAKVISVISEGDDLSTLTGFLTYGKDINGKALPFSVVSDGDSATSLTGMYILGKDDDGNIAPIRINGDSGGLITIETEHEKVHDGVSFCRQIDSNNSAVATLNAAFKTKDSGDIHILFEFGASDTAQFELIEGATWDQGSGTALDIFNHKRDGGDSTLVLEDKNQVAFTASNQLIQDVTTVTGGTVIYNKFTYAARQVGGGSRSVVIERELKADTTYVFRAAKTGGGTAKLDIDLNWYEVA